MWEEKSIPNSRKTPAVFNITAWSEGEPKIMATFMLSQTTTDRGMKTSMAPGVGLGIP
jgi:hypothetical protein